MKKKIRPDMFIITPGIQLEGEESTDQTRVTTPRKAFEAGATHIMIGRSITKADDPRAVFDRVCAELGV
ncbi:orotidine 5'-phosphate decarboxylase / HUMPS family protein [Collimonas pratensis]|uniref:Orotidine 5'-phosphate decarboxylase n=1 Tax=Collimonas pratensis TaxID=279113 RepID=A0ABM5Z509_9BURK|nr:orotidine 5'-phosphate decarboxylase / HUMPS family protein [Collimonas pratensis]